MRAPRGFTLIELLIVVSIIALLMGMVMTMMSTARAAAMKGATRAIMGKVDVGLRLFKNEIGSYPWQISYADVAIGDPPTNRLAWHLGTTMNKDQRLDLFYDQDTAAEQFRYNCYDPANEKYVELTALLKEPAYRTSRLLPVHQDNRGAWDSASNNISYSRFLNRLAEERARLALAIGNTDARGPKIINKDTKVVKHDASATKLVATPKSQGWAADYLGGDLESRYRRGDEILDAWRRPLAYVANILPGARGTTVNLGANAIKGFDTSMYDLGPLGRKTLWPLGSGSDKPMANDPPYLPDINRLIHSDCRFYARPSQEREFELISAGADARMDWMRDAPVNLDNILGGDYLRGLR